MGLEPGKTYTTKMGDPVVKEEDGWYDEDGNYGVDHKQEKAERTCEVIMDEMGHTIRELKGTIFKLQAERDTARELLIGSGKQITSLAALKEALRVLRVKTSKELDADCGICNDIDGHFHDMLGDVQHYIEKEAETEETGRSDFEEHNVWNHAQLGIE